MLTSIMTSSRKGSAHGLLNGARGSAGKLWRGSFHAAWLVPTLLCACASASAAGLHAPGSAIAVVGLLTAVLLIREWPAELTVFLWAAGTVFALAVWVLRQGHRVSAAPEPLAVGLMSGILHGSTRCSSLGPDAHKVAAESADVLRAARQCFVRLQAAWDAGDIDEMKRYTTVRMLEDLLQELPEHRSPNRTDVLTLNASLLVLEKGDAGDVASVEFSGLIRESPEEPAVAFDEVWMLTCRQGDPSGWRLARQQALF